MIYIALMLIYSWLLTLIPLCSSDSDRSNSGWAPLFRRQFLQPKMKPRAICGGAYWYPDGESPERGDDQPLALESFIPDLSRTFAKMITGTASKPVRYFRRSLSDGALDWCILV